MSAIDQLDTRVASALYGRFPTLRDAQEAAIIPILKGRNLVLSSGTGSGKTEAVVAPLLSRLWRQAHRSKGITVLYVAPTKALVNDLEKRLAGPLDSLGLRVGIRHGDRDDLVGQSPPHLLITTPESLDVLLFRHDAALATIKALVVDEVHLLYNTQRGLHLAILLRRLQEFTGAAVQWAALSATIGRLSYVKEFLAAVDSNTEFVESSAAREIDAQIRAVPSEAALRGLIARLTEGRATKLLIFANSRRECERLAGVLSNEEGLRGLVFAHYSSLSSEVRVETERKFASSPTAVCIATSTLELGIDIGDIDAVLLWGVPGGVESFLQRIGRGNRRSNKTNVVCLIPNEGGGELVDCLRFVALVDAARRGELPIRSPYELFGASAQQCLNMIAADGGRFTRVADLSRLVGVREYLTRSSVESILAELQEKEFVKHHGFKNRFGADEELHRLTDFRMIYGNFGLGSQTIEIHYGSKNLGSVPAANLLRIHGGSVVRFAGKHWRVNRATEDGIRVEPAKSGRGAIDFMYGGRGPCIDAFIANRIWRCLHIGTDFGDLLASALRKRVEKWVEAFRKQVRQEQLPYVRTSQGVCYLTFGGYLVNKAVGLITESVGFRADDLCLKTPAPIDWSSVPDRPEDYESVFLQLFEPSSVQTIFQRLLPSDLQIHEYLQEWLKDETVVDVLQRLVRATPTSIPTELAGPLL